jgi:type II secretory pathway component PulK
MKKIIIQDILHTSRTRARSGYVLLATLMLIALGVGVISTVVQRALNYQRIMRVALDREKARMLALGGIQLALAQVSFIHEDKQEQEQDREQKENQTEKSAEEPSKLIVTCSKYMAAGYVYSR